MHSPSSKLELVDQVPTEEELVPRRSVVISQCIPRVIEAHLRPQHDRAADAFDSTKLEIFRQKEIQMLSSRIERETGSGQMKRVSLRATTPNLLGT